MGDTSKHDNFKKISEEEPEKVKINIRLKLEKQRKEENQQLYSAYIFHSIQLIVIIYAIYKVLNN